MNIVFNKVLRVTHHRKGVSVVRGALDGSLFLGRLYKIVKVQIVIVIAQILNGIARGLCGNIVMKNERACVKIDSVCIRRLDLCLSECLGVKRHLAYRSAEGVLMLASVLTSENEGKTEHLGMIFVRAINRLALSAVFINDIADYLIRFLNEGKVYPLTLSYIKLGEISINFIKCSVFINTYIKTGNTVVMYLKIDGLVAVACSAVPAVSVSAVIVTEYYTETARGRIGRYLHLKGEGVRKNFERVAHSPFFSITRFECHTRFLCRKGIYSRYRNK